MNRVFVIHQPATRDRRTGRMRPYFDLSPALQFGRVVNVLPPGGIIQDYDRLSLDIERRLKEERFGPKDYILALGDPAAIAIGVLVVARLARPLETIQLLKWDKKLSSYIVCKVPV